jgi:ankyrin repeat protein
MLLRKWRAASGEPGNVMRTVASRIIHIGVVTLTLTGVAFGGEIHEAVKRGDVDRVKALIIENPRVVFNQDDTGWTPLHLAAQKGFKDIAELLLANKAEVNARSKRGDTPLHWAAGNGHKEIVELLLGNQADVNAQDNGGWTPLHMAARPGYQEVLQVLLANKAKVNIKDNEGWHQPRWCD